MRLFVALPVAEPARAELVRVLAALRATDWPVRWTRGDHLHLTLKFFGEVPAGRLSDVEAALQAAAATTGALALQLTELGTFPGRGRPRVLWAGVQAASGLELLQDAIERRTGSIGFPSEGRLFHPHITLGRVRDGHRLTAGEFERLAGQLEPVPFLADTVMLYESVLGAGGARHIPRLTLALDR